MYNLVWKQKPAMNRDLKVEEERWMDSLGPWLEESVWADKGEPLKERDMMGFSVKKDWEGQRPEGQDEHQVIVSVIPVRDDRGWGREDGVERTEMNKAERVEYT